MRESSIYDSERLALAYARSRPFVHAQVLAAAKARIERRGIGRARRALDIGCGAGLSTAALDALAEERVGIEPVPRMLRHHRDVAPHARFVSARVEALPFPDAAFDLLTAAGALNYADLDTALPEIGRVLRASGGLLVYDFSGGRRLAGDGRLERWFAAFEERYPYPPGYAMDVRSLPFTDVGMRVADYEEIEAALPMSGEEYLAYALSETNVELALLRGEREETIASWCRAGLSEIFADGRRPVLFDAYWAYIEKSVAQS